MLRGPSELVACQFANFDGYFSEHWLRQIYLVLLQGKKKRKTTWNPAWYFPPTPHSPLVSFPRHFMQIIGNSSQESIGSAKVLCASRSTSCVFITKGNKKVELGNHLSLDYCGFQGTNDDPLATICLCFFSFTQCIKWIRLEAIREKSLSHWRPTEPGGNEAYSWSHFLLFPLTPLLG